MKRTPRFSMRGLTALDGSIRKWEKIVKKEGTDKQNSNCPLCEIYRKSNLECPSCPVCVFSGKPMCCNTPYIDWAHHVVGHDIRTWKVYCDTCLKYAKAELTFLHKVRKWYLTFKGKPCQRQR